jgi:hypothetical protein
MKLAEQSSAVIYTIGVFDEDDPDRNPGVLKRLAQATGGEAFFPANSPKWRHLRAHRTGHSSSIHDRICSEQPRS